MKLFVTIFFACVGIQFTTCQSLETEAAIASMRQSGVSAASTHAIAIMKDGSLWSWGVAIDHWSGLSLIGDGTVYARPLPVQIMENVTFAVAGHAHSLAITGDGALWAWGDNQFGQIGDGTTETRLSPVRIMEDVVYAAMPRIIPDSHFGETGERSYAIQSNGNLWAWGSSGDTGARDIALGDGARENRHSPVLILENVTQVVPTPGGGFAVTACDTLWHWHGAGWDGSPAQLYAVPIMENVALVSSNGVFVITNDGQLRAIEGESSVWIMNNVAFVATESFSNIDRSSSANFAITKDGALWAWGENTLESQQWRMTPLLGDGTTTARDTPVKIMSDVVYVTVMGNATYAITRYGTLWAWGWGILGDGTIHTLHLSPVPILENVMSVAPTFSMFDHGWATGVRTFATTLCGSVYAWGDNINVFGLSILGDGTSERQLSPVRILDGENF